MKRFLFALALMATIGLGGLAIESASAQNMNSNMNKNMERHENDMQGMRGRHHRRGGHHRRHRRGGMHKMHGNNNM